MSFCVLVDRKGSAMRSGWVKSPGRNLAVLRRFLLNGGDTADAGKEKGLSNPQAWRVVEDAIGAKAGREIASRVFAFAVYQTFQALRNYRKVRQIFRLSMTRVRKEVEIGHQMVAPEQQGSLLELFACKRCGGQFESPNPQPCRYCSTCRPVVTAELTKARVARWKERNPEQARLLELRGRLKQRLKELERRYSTFLKGGE